MVLKMEDPARPMSAMHSEMSFMEYLSTCVFALRARKSCTIRRPCPVFFGTQKMGELYSDLVRRTTPSFSQLSKVASMNC